MRQAETKRPQRRASSKNPIERKPLDERQKAFVQGMLDSTRDQAIAEAAQARQAFRAQVEQIRNTSFELEALVGATAAMLAIPRVSRAAASSARHLAGLAASSMVTLGEQLAKLLQAVKS